MMTDNLPAAKKFLAQYWQKKPLYARGAMKSLASDLDRARMIELACRDDVESRLVMGARTAWRVEHGPFRRRDFARLPPRGWTLLINGLETLLPAARELQRAFNFIPYARHDDVMASYAVQGGSVGPHFDSYDVCLVQGTGTRHWQISAQRDLELVARAPLKILRRFKAQREWRVGTGDVLYLPPRYAHHGVALDECITWSVGFRAPGRREFTERLLDYLRDQPRADAPYRDAALKTQRHPGVIGSDMLGRIKAMVGSLRWTDADLERCLGEYLTEPRATVTFKHPRRVAPARFGALLADRGLRLAAGTRLLTSGTHAFINGETAPLASASRSVVMQLADTRFIPARLRINADARALLHSWHAAGYVQVND